MRTKTQRGLGLKWKSKGASYSMDLGRFSFKTGRPSPDSIFVATFAQAGSSVVDPGMLRKMRQNPLRRGDLVEVLAYRARNVFYEDCPEAPGGEVIGEHVVLRGMLTKLSRKYKPGRLFAELSGVIEGSL